MSDEGIPYSLEDRDVFLHLIEYRINWLENEIRHLKRVRDDVSNEDAEFDEFPEVYLQELGLELEGPSDE